MPRVPAFRCIVMAAQARAWGVRFGWFTGGFAFALHCIVRGEGWCHDSVTLEVGQATGSDRGVFS